MDPRSEVILRQLDFFKGSVLLAGLPADQLIHALKPQISSLCAWSWHFGEYSALTQLSSDCHFSAEPPEQQFDQAIIFLPKSKELTNYLLQRIASRLKPQGELFLVGEKRAGIERAAKQLQPYGKTLKLDSARHCQLWQCNLSGPVNDKPLIDWAKTVVLEPFDHLKVVSLPGVFSHGELDHGTALLLQHLDNLPKGDLLDFGCGAGVIGCFLKKKYPQQTVHFLDVDAFALAATRLSLAANQIAEDDGVHLIAGRGIADAPHNLGAIISNPPFHQGIHTSYQASEDLLTQAVLHLNPSHYSGSELRIVANSFLKYPPLLKTHFGHCHVLAQGHGFHVYQAKRS
ncbi:class I SAM-dependent methyltransferase [Alkanindiges illinoisensis]|uniref:class I SAM-dependent methyltransferase n=1 Tax=Alkanindiges illinoisensis TaxID=197183 RepID=UPI00047BBB6A|nr:class I SAM-dependent methyltransferase [Alkanindiges illinoisensis]